ncbi:MAG: hypothetical protein ACR2HY_06595 [Acidimicrobiales bacterium]
MFRRLFWLATGMAAGVGSSFWVARRVRQTVSRYSPPQVASRGSRAVRRFCDDVGAAVADGRRAMRQAEADLLADERAGRR